MVGKLFQMTGPATAKLLIPSMVLALGMDSNPVRADRSVSYLFIINFVTRLLHKQDIFVFPKHQNKYRQKKTFILFCFVGIIALLFFFVTRKYLPFTHRTDSTDSRCISFFSGMSVLTLALCTVAGFQSAFKCTLNHCTSSSSSSSSSSFHTTADWV